MGAFASGRADSNGPALNTVLTQHMKSVAINTEVVCGEMCQKANNKNYGVNHCSQLKKIIHLNPSFFKVSDL